MTRREPRSGGSIAGPSFIKMSLLQPYNSMPRFDIIYLSEIYLYNFYHSHDNQLPLRGYNLIRTDNPSSMKEQKLASIIKKLYHKINLRQCSKCLVCELSFWSPHFCLVSIYWISSQSSNEYDIFLLNLEGLLKILNSLKTQRGFQCEIF